MKYKLSMATERGYNYEEKQGYKSSQSNVYLVHCLEYWPSSTEQI